MQHKDRIVRFIVSQSRLLILILLLVLFSVTTKSFWSMGNWTNVSNMLLQQAPFLIMLSLGMTICIIICGIDLSIGASISLSAYCAALVLQNFDNPILAIALAIVIGAIVGVINGVLIAIVKVQPFVATFSMQWICKGFALVISNGIQIYDLGTKFRPLFNTSPYTYIIIALVCAFLLWILLSKTTLGQNIYYIGANKKAAKMSGIRVEQTTIGVFALIGVIAAITGVMYIANLGGAEPTMGDGFPLKAVASALVGGAALGGAKGKVSNAVIGAFIMVTLQNGMIHIGIPSEWQDFIQGAVIIFAIMLERGLEVVQKKTVSNELAK